MIMGARNVVLVFILAYDIYLLYQIGFQFQCKWEFEGFVAVAQNAIGWAFSK